MNDLSCLISSEAFEEIAEKKMMHCKHSKRSREYDLVKHLFYGMGHCIVQRYWRRLWVYRKVVDEEASIFTNSLGG
jgi:hypothetical protein